MVVAMGCFVGGLEPTVVVAEAVVVGGLEPMAVVAEAVVASGLVVVAIRADGELLEPTALVADGELLEPIEVVEGGFQGGPMGCFLVVLERAEAKAEAEGVVAGSVKNHLRKCTK